MKYFLDTEFIEGTQKTLFGQTKPTIDLISIGIVCEDGREYYAVSKDFNLKEAWNRFDLVKKNRFQTDGETYYEKVYWIRDNVLFPMYSNHVHGDARNHIPFTHKTMKGILNGFGKTNKQIAEEIKDFVSYKHIYAIKDSLLIEGMASETRMTYEGRLELLKRKNQLPKFYAYYADYDWVAFCWLFGKMIDLPKGFPMYCIDLKQELESSNETLGYNSDNENNSYKLQKKPDYPKQTNEHHALMDARWTKQLYEFLKNL